MHIPLIAAAFAQDATQAPGAASLMGIAPLIILFVIFYFLLIRPQQKKAKEHRKMISELAKGDNVITNGGLHGRITGVSDDTVTLEIAENVRVKVQREAVAINKKQS